MAKRTSNDIGSDLEKEVAEIVGGRVVPQSGGGSFIKLDVGDEGGFAYSCKSTEQEKISDAGIRAIKKLWQEADRGARGPAGHGTGAKPAVIFGFEGEILMLCRLRDHTELATGEAPPYVTPSKVEQRRSKISKSSLG